MIQRTNKRIGVIGCAAILPRVLLDPVKDIPHLHVYGCANRTRSKAEAYAAEYGIPVVFDSAEALLASDEIDFVYILLSNELHAEWTIKAIEAGKHVMVEKPLCLTSGEAERIVEAARKGRVHVLEALMVQHHPWQEQVRQWVADSTYGALREIDSRISFTPKASFEGNYRSFPEKGGGSFYDLGCYWLQFLQSTVGLEPVAYEGRSAFAGLNGCDWTFDTELRYESGLTARLTTSFEQAYKASHTLHFEAATVTVVDFFRANLGPYAITLKIEDRTTGATSKWVSPPQHYYQNQLLFFSDVLDGIRDNVPLTASLERIRLQELIYQSAQQPV
ncbi:Gfo/Idh/MocA family oxidoreductase [Paenibacillus athensensis]|uniref:Oxidoreductase n=1 Tax=Paenibacillus athensensis TaxID=1967502 RepID=A0A4Y8QAM7_9BACL|nr:Gfo/Idh/MocA family oxidoreductase [Paenibacillus athensensis]MCD1257608.1 Gfo/Idh/MocA family oxidoreductase [Paenibacillus athensensis]